MQDRESHTHFSYFHAIKVDIQKKKFHESAYYKNYALFRINEKKNSDVKILFTNPSG